jgi:serine/threonine protein kinase
MAIKKIPINDYATAEREINTVVTLEHKNVINFYNREIDEERKYVYLGLGYCEGTLKDIININSKVPAKIDSVRSDPAKESLLKIMKEDRKKSKGLASYLRKLMFGTLEGLGYLHS